MNYNTRNKVTLGRLYEQKAGEYLKRLGYQILEFNFRCRYSEIDIIAKDKDCIVFCEVKYRNQKDSNIVFESITPAKQKRISHAALYYLTTHNLMDVSSRFDVIGFTESNITHIENAFSFIGV